jgi:hypothetical protein
MEKFIRREKGKEDNYSLEELKFSAIALILALFLFATSFLSEKSGKEGFFPVFFTILGTFYMTCGILSIVYKKFGKQELLKKFLLFLFIVGLLNILSILTSGVIFIDLYLNYKSCDMIIDDSCYLERIFVSITEGLCVILQIITWNFNIFLIVKIKQGRNLLKSLNFSRYEHLV